MKATTFNEQNIIIAKDQPQYQPLPAHRSRDEMGQVIFCMKMNFKERIKSLFTGKIWVSLATFGKPVQDSFFSTKKTDMFTKEYIQKRKGNIRLLKDLEKIEDEFDL